MAMNNSYFSMPLNINRVCRICLLENTSLQPIFCDKQADDNPSDLSQKIQICGGVECQEQDGLPALICAVCTYKASVAFEFRQLCQHSDTRLRLYYNKPTKYNSAIDSCTQTDMQTQALLIKSAEGLQNTYYVKVEDEVLSNTQFQTSLTNGEFNSNAQIPVVNLNISVSETIPINSQSIDCTQELVPVAANLIDTVCDLETEINVDNGVKNVDYYTYVTKDQPIVINDNLQRNILNEKSKNNQHNENFNGNNLTGDTYFATNVENKIQEKIKCQYCSKSFNTLILLKKHLVMHDKQKISEFNNIEKDKSDAELEENKNTKQTNYSEQNNQLEYNEMNFKIEDSDDDDDEDDESGNELKNCLEKALNGFKCEVCGLQCSTLKNLKRHALTHGDKKYSCTVCKKWFFRPDTLKKHAEKHGHGLLDNISDNNKLYESDDDALSQNNDNNKNNYSKKETVISEDETNGDYKCQHCDKVMNSKKGLRRHVAMHKPKPEPAVCEICNKVCASRARLALHQKTHNKIKDKVPREYLCHICSKVYPSNSSLTYHMRTHTGIKPHVCKICNSGFTTTTSLTNHMRIHTGDKPFVCHVCSAAFAVSSAFRRHLTRHTGEANYLCKTCGKAFKRLSTLKEHTYTHSGEKPYVCKNCSAAYTHSGSLFAHQKRCRAQVPEITVIEENNQHSSDHHVINQIF